MRRAVLMLTVLAGLSAAVAGLLRGYEVATAALAVTMVGALGWVVLWARRVNAVLGRVEARARETNAVLGRIEEWTRETNAVLGRIEERARETPDALDAMLARLEETRAGFHDVASVLKRQQGALDKHATVQGHHTGKLDELRQNLDRVMNRVQQGPSATIELGRAYDRLVDHDRPMPELGGWAMTSSTLVWILDRIAVDGLTTILECGSGSSTVWFATALERRGGEGRVVALESSAEYAEQTRAQLRSRGLDHRAEVIHTPLVDTEIPGRDVQPWFDLADLPALPPVDLLFVDGPVGAIAYEARFPAFPLLADRLAPGATVILDDTGRPDETSIVQQWAAESHHGRRLAVVAAIDRSTVFATVEEVDGPSV